MGWYWQIVKNDEQHCLHVVDTAKNISVMELLPKQITLGEFVDRIVGISTDEKITDYDFKEMVYKIERSRDNIKDKLLLWNGKFETAWDIARGLYYIQVGCCPSSLATSYGRYAGENIRTKFAIVYLDSDARTFWTLTRKQAEEFNNRQMINVTSTRPSEIYDIVCKVFEDAASLVNDTFSKCLEIAFEKVNNREVPLEDVLVPMMLDEFLLHVYKSTKGKNARVDRLYAISWEMALNRMKKKHENQRR